jgi:hypothetical protein
MTDQPFQPQNPQQPIRVAHGVHLDQPPAGAAPQPPYAPPPPPPAVPYGAYPPQVIVQPVMVPQPVDPASGQAVTSLVLGITGLVFGALGFSGCTIPIGLVLGIIGIVLGALGRRSFRHGGLATAGLVLSVIALAVSVGWGAWWLALVNSAAVTPSPY